MTSQWSSVPSLRKDGELGLNKEEVRFPVEKKKKQQKEKERKKENNKEKPNQQNREYLIFIRKWYSYRTRTVNSQNHCHQLPEDLQNLEKWESDWLWIQRRTKSYGFMAQFQNQHLYMLMKQTVTKQWRQQSLSNRTELASASFSKPGLVAQAFQK